MATSQRPENLREELTCSICLDYFTDPVCLQCGHNFCRPCITRCWQRPSAPPLCPQCRAVCTGRALHPNMGLRNIAEVIRMSITPQSQEGAVLCPLHQQRLQLFCETDQRPICVVCDRSKEHRWHDVIPVEEAAQEYQGALKNRIKQLNKELEDLQKRRVEESRTAVDLEVNPTLHLETVHRKFLLHARTTLHPRTSVAQLGIADGRSLLLQRNFKIQTVKLIGVFEHLKLFLEKEKKQLLTRLEKEHKVYMKITQEKVSDLEKQQSAYRSLITEMEGMCPKQDVELLKGAPSVLNRCDHVKTLKPEEDVTLLPTAQRIEHLYIQEKLMELKKTFPVELDTLISGIQMKALESEQLMLADVQHLNAFYESKDDWVKKKENETKKEGSVQKLDVYQVFKDMSSQNARRTKRIIKRVATTN